MLSVDLGRLNTVIDIDEESGLARIQAGTLGPDLEEQLGATGLDHGALPRLLHPLHPRRLGGDPLVRACSPTSTATSPTSPAGLRVVVPGDVLVIRPLPSTSTGPSVREMILGSEGRLGVITEVTVQVHRLPEERIDPRLLLPDLGGRDGGHAGRSRSRDAHPVGDPGLGLPRDRASRFATSKDQARLRPVLAWSSKGLMKVLEQARLGPRTVCLSFIGFEGGKSHVAREQKLVEDIVGQARRHRASAPAPGVLYDQKKFDTPYLRDFLLDRGAAGDVSETAAPWSRLTELYDDTVAAANARVRPDRRQGLDHVPPVALATTRVPACTSPSPSVRRRRPAGRVRRGEVAPSSRASSTTAARSRTTTPSAPSTRRGWRRTSRPPAWP